MAGRIVVSSIDGKFGELVDRGSWAKSKRELEGISPRPAKGKGNSSGDMK